MKTGRLVVLSSVGLAVAFAGARVGAETVVLTDNWSQETTVADDVSFGAVETPVAPCAVALPAARGANSLTLYPSSLTSPFVFSGGPLTFGARGLIAQPLGGTARFDLPVADTASSGLDFASDAEILTYDTQFVPKTNAILFPGRNLDDIVPIRSKLGGENVNGWGNAYFITRGDGWLTADYQIDASVDPNYIKCARVRLEQQGEDIVGRVVLAYYWSKGSGNPGAFPGDSPRVTTTSIAITQSSGAYGIAILRVVAAAKAAARFSGAFAVNGPLVLAPYQDVQLTNAAAGVDGAFTNALRIAEGATLTLGATTNVAVKGAIGGTNGTLAVHSALPPTTTDETRIAKVSAKTRNKAAWESTLVAKGRRATDIARIENPVLGNVGSTTGTVITTAWAPDRSSVTYQIQVKSDWLKMVFVKFYDAGDGVRSVLTRSCYSSASNFGKDFTDKTSLGEYQSYYLGSSELVFTNNAQGVVALSGANGSVEGTVKVLPGSFATVAAASCPATGTLEVGAGARLQSGGLRGTRALRFVAHAGSITTIDGHVGDSSTAGNVPLTLDGAELQFQFAGGERDGETGCYVQDLTLKNGARVIGGKMRVAGGALRTITGTGVQTNAAGALNCSSGSGGTSGTMTVDVADTTGDAAADYVITGPVTYYTSGYQGLTLVKTGAGTMRQEGTIYNGMTLPIRIEAGVFELGKSGVINGTKQTFTLSGGGGIAVAAGCTNTVGTLKLTGDGTIVLQPGAALSIADSSAVAWTDGKLLQVTVTNDQMTGLRFGTSSAGLTAAQLKQVRVNGLRAKIDENGYIYHKRMGCAVIVR